MARIRYRQIRGDPTASELYENDRALAREAAVHDQRLTVLEADADGGAIELQVFAQLSCAPSLDVGDCACIVGADAVRADPSRLDRMPAVGVVASKPTATTAMVRLGLLARGLYGELTPGTIYYVGADGRPAAAAPVAADLGVLLVVQQPIGIAVGSDALLVAPSPGMFIDQV